MTSEYLSCHICKKDYKADDMVPDIDGAAYCYYCADMCWSCGVYQHDCEKEDANA